MGGSFAVDEPVLARHQGVVYEAKIVEFDTDGASTSPSTTTVRVRPRRLSALRVHRSESVLHGAFVRARRARDTEHGGLTPAQESLRDSDGNFYGITQEHRVRS
jgi:hypothetical protein